MDCIIIWFKSRPYLTESFNFTVKRIEKLQKANIFDTEMKDLLG